jgi:1,4-alpha-glucan branching enzyme
MADGWVLRALVHGADRLDAFGRDGNPIGARRCIDPAGLFESGASRERLPAGYYEARGGGNTWRVICPYLFGPVLGPLDGNYAAEGSHLRLYDMLGAQTAKCTPPTPSGLMGWAPTGSRPHGTRLVHA